MQKTKVAVVCKLMPLYRLGVFQKLSSNKIPEFTFFGDTKEQGGIKQIPFTYARAPNGNSIRWHKTKNYFYKPELLLWQTKILKQILFSDYKIFVFEGAVSHYPVWIFSILCKIKKKKVLFWTHGFKGNDLGLRKYIRKFFFKNLADGLLLYGHHQKEIMLENNFDENNLYVVYNSLTPKKQFEILSGLNQEIIADKKRALFTNPEYFTILFIGRLVEGKKVMEILKCLLKLKKQQIFVNCLYIGEGHEKSNLYSFSDKNGLNNQVHFTGALYDEMEIASYFSMADLMVSPGNVGLNCIHSLAYGIPVLTHNNFTYQNPEVEAIIDGKTGAFFEYNDFLDLELKLLEWIQNPRNKKNTKDECQNVIKKIYNPENQARCIIQAVNQTLN